MNRPVGSGVSLGFGGPAPKDIWILLGILFATYSLQYFAFSRPLLELLRLTPDVWQRLFVWQAFTYPWIGSGGPQPSLWILLELLIIYWFAGEVRRTLGQKRFWQLFALVPIAAAGVAISVDIVMGLVGQRVYPFQLMQGQRIISLTAIAAFATLRANATILLFFVLPIKARYFIWLEVLFAFIGFLGNKDFAGFVGVCTAIWLTVNWLRRGPRRPLPLRELRLRWERWWIQQKLGRMRKKSDLRLVKDQDRDGWVN